MKFLKVWVGGLLIGLGVGIWIGADINGDIDRMSVVPSLLLAMAGGALTHHGYKGV